MRLEEIDMTSRPYDHVRRVPSVAAASLMGRRTARGRVTYAGRVMTISLVVAMIHLAELRWIWLLTSG